MSELTSGLSRKYRMMYWCSCPDHNCACKPLTAVKTNTTRFYTSRGLSLLKMAWFDPGIQYNARFISSSSLIRHILLIFYSCLPHHSLYLPLHLCLSLSASLLFLSLSVYIFVSLCLSICPLLSVCSSVCITVSLCLSPCSICFHLSTNRSTTFYMQTSYCLIDDVCTLFPYHMSR